MQSQDTTRDPPPALRFHISLMSPACDLPVWSQYPDSQTIQVFPPITKFGVILAPVFGKCSPGLHLELKSLA
jgi:hypothetical protein